MHHDRHRAHQPDKAALRTQLWALLRHHAVTSGDPTGHIPAFLGADQAATHLAHLNIWHQARTIMCTPDTPQIAVQRLALHQGKALYTPVPRLAHDPCFLHLNPAHLGMQPTDAAISVQMLQQTGQPVALHAMHPVDLVVVGSVAVDRAGRRIGKGAGFTDLELAILQQAGLLVDTTPIVTTVHALQIVEVGRLLMFAHDWPLDWIVTPDAAIATHTPYPRPEGIVWEHIQAEQLQHIPILQRLRAGAGDADEADHEHGL
jgi:5-formyltetrahydrofolate cyclo-ligase